MKTGIKVSLIALVSFLVVIGALFVTGLVQPLMFVLMQFFLSPDQPFNGKGEVDAPDYRSEIFWAALPEKDDPSDLVPEGVVGARDKPVDVFFIHPTGYLSGASWTSPMNPDSAAEENTNWMLANQASAYNGCCEVYAPRYREASIFAYFNDAAVRDAVLGFAYEDVARAFDDFIANRNQGRPFIIASHSQGTHHARRLLKEKIDGTPLFDSLVAAYLIGSVMIEFPDSYFDAMTDIEPCRSADDVGCVVHWDTFAEGSAGLARVEGSLCTNPLTWRVDEEKADASLGHGAVPIGTPYNLSFMPGNEPVGAQFDHLAAPLPGHTWAQCRGGTLFVADQSNGPIGGGSGGNYHGLDYNLFYMDIRDNAILRADTWLAARPYPQPGVTAGTR